MVVIPQNQISVLYGVWVGESLEKIMSCKIPSGPCEPVERKTDGLPLVFGRQERAVKGKQH